MNKLNKLFFIALLSVFVNFGCEPTDEVTDTPTETDEEITDTEVVENESMAWIDFENLSIGQQIGGFRVENIDSSMQSEENPWMVEIDFAGPLTLKGKVKHFAEDHASLAGLICVTELDEESKKLLPRAKNDPRDKLVLFCFNNTSIAQRILSTNPGEKYNLQFSVGNFLFHGQDAEIRHEARFMDIVDRF